MTSGLKNPVILVNGELDATSQVAAGYNDIYGSRVNYDRERNADYEWSIDESLRIGDITQEEANPMYEGTKNTKSILLNNSLLITTLDVGKAGPLLIKSS